MEGRLSREELLQGVLQEGEVRDAILNPVTNTETFANNIALWELGLIKNASNLVGNTYDIVVNQRNSDAYKKALALKNQKGLDTSGKIDALSDVIFGDTSANPINQLFGTNVSKAHASMQADVDATKRKNILAGQYGGGGIGEISSEIVGALPIMKYGSMSSTSSAINLGLNKVGLAKSIAKDAIRNAGVLSSTEFLLAKAYGRSDEEAVGNAIAAGLLGVGGTPLVGIGKKFVHSVGSEERALRENFEAGGSEAGGGKPPEYKPTEDAPDLKVSEPKTPKTEAEKSKEVIEKVEYDVVDPKATKGVELEGQVDVPEVSNPKRYDSKFGVTGRRFNKEGNLLSPQGTAEQKASLVQRPDVEIKNAVDEVSRRMDNYDNESELRKAYGQTQTKFKQRQESTKAEDVRNRNNYMINQFEELRRDKTLGDKIRQDATKELKRLKSVSISDTAVSPEMRVRALDDFEKQYDLEKPIDLEARNTDLKDEYKGYVKSIGGSDEKGLLDLETKSGTDALVNGIKSSANKTDVVKAIEDVQIKEKLSAKEFDFSNITNEQRKKYPDEIAKIEDYFHSKEDIKLFNSGDITSNELRYRAKRRLDDSVFRDKEATKEGKLPTLEEANRYDRELSRMYADIGVFKKASGVKITDNNVREKSDGVKTSRPEVDDTEIKKSEEVNKSILKSIQLFRDKGIRSRRTSKESSKGGQYSLSDATIKEIEDGILTNEQIANKLSPIGSSKDRVEAVIKAKEIANKAVSDYHKKSLGITKRFKKPDAIEFKDAVVDASNSVMQVATVLLGSKNLAKLSKLHGGKTDVREMIAENISKDLGKPVDKAMVKPVFMTKNYGQGDKGLINNLMKDNNMSRKEATEFLEAYQRAEGDLIPELKMLQDLVYSKMKSGESPNISWTLPDGLKVDLNIVKELDGSISIKGRELPIKIQGKDIDEVSRALMPNVIHSVDAYVARRMNALGYPSIHDAFTLKKGLVKEDVDKAYTKIMQEINDSDLLKKILDDIGIDSSKLPEKDLPSSIIAESPHKLGTEHAAGSGLEGGDLKKSMRIADVSKANTSDEVMKDFMASGNVRQVSTPQMIDALVNESTFRTMSKALDNDDVFERQIALAHQSSEYNKAFEIKVPDGVNAESWYKNQEDIFNEARAKLEYNPILRRDDILQGERKYFGKDGEILGSGKEPYSKFLQREKRIKRKLDKLNNSEQKAQLDVVGKDYKAIVKAVDSWSVTKNLTEDELAANKLVNEIKTTDATTMSTETKSGLIKYFKDQYKDSVQSKAFTRIFNIRAKNEKEVQYRAEKLLNEFNRLMKDEDNEAWTKHLLDTDFHSIRHLDKESAEEFAKEFDWVYQRAKQHIDQGAKALNNDSQQIGAYLNNARAISDAVGLGRGHDVIIDKLISIKAMSDESWKFVDEKRGTELWDLSMDVLLNNRKQSAELFGDNKEKFVKGYVKEFYDGGKHIVDQKVIYDAEAKVEPGIIPSSLEAKKVGKVTDNTKNVSYSYFKNQQEIIDYALANELKVTDKGFRQVQNESLRNEAGRSRDFARLVTETSHSIDEKVAGRTIADDLLEELTKSDSLISTKPKSGYREISLEQKDALPYSLKGNIRYVHEDYFDRILGREETRLTQKGKETAGANQQWKVADRILADFVSNFKQNVVLKNISSFKNAILVNQTIGAMAGVNPAKSFKMHREAYSQIKRNDNLRSRMAVLKARGKPYEHIEARLMKSELYQMEQLGLSLNQLDGVRGDSSLLAHMLSDFTGNRFDRIANEVLLNQKGTTGKFTTSVFSTIDTQGRFTLTKHFMDEGLSMQEAVNKANGLFGDMDQMAPVLVEAMDKYGAIPFLKWYTRTTPQLLKLAKDNPKKTALLSVAIYALSAESDINFSTVNPIEAAIDFAESAVTLDYLEAVTAKGFVNPTVRKLTPYIIPNAWQDIDRVLTDVGDEYTLRPGIKQKSYNPIVKDRINSPWDDSSLDYRGFTQQIIQGL